MQTAIKKRNGKLEMVHQYKNNGYNIVLDVNSGSVHVVDDMVYDIIALYEKMPLDTIVEELENKYPENDIREAYSEIEQLKEAGVCKNFEDIGTYMWHGGAHHVGFDVHDVVEESGLAVPGVVFCVDIGVYHEEWGIGFRLEDNCLITEDGCENLSRAIPRQIDEIEAFMGRR